MHPVARHVSEALKTYRKEIEPLLENGNYPMAAMKVGNCAYGLRLGMEAADCPAVISTLAGLSNSFERLSSACYANSKEEAYMLKKCVDQSIGIAMRALKGPGGIDIDADAPDLIRFL